MQLVATATLGQSVSLAWLKLASPLQQGPLDLHRQLQTKDYHIGNVCSFRSDVCRATENACETRWRYNCLPNDLVAMCPAYLPHLLLLLCLLSTWLSMFLFRQATATPIYAVPECTALITLTHKHYWIRCISALRLSSTHLPVFVKACNF